MKVYPPLIAIELNDGSVIHLSPEEAQELSHQLAAVLPAEPLAFRPLPIVDMPTAAPAVPPIVPDGGQP